MDTSKQELIDCLEQCVRQSEFISDRMGRVDWSTYRQLARRRRWSDIDWMHWSTAELEIEDSLVDVLAGKLEPVLAEFIHAESGKIGNGLILLFGGSETWAHQTVAEFARTLITAAVKSSASQVVKLLLTWSKGEPLRSRMCYLLEGADIDEELQLSEGICISKLPTSSEDLPASLPWFGMAAPIMDFIGGVVISIDCEFSPALYCPDETDFEGINSHREKFSMVSGKIPNFSLDSFCESISLAGNGCIDWFVQWSDFGELDAFKNNPPGVGYKPRLGIPGTKISQAHLDGALKIHQARHEGGGLRENLELAIRRWIRSKRPGSDMDKLIELRIALEALYEIGGVNEKGFRIATYGAWHLGEDFQQRKEYREILRKTYSDSSSAVHGGKVKHAAQNPDLVSSAQDICRDGILKRLEEVEKPNWDEMILGAEI